MRIIAVTGGIGAGKSTVARGLAERGAQLLDGDQVARAVVDPTDPIGAETTAQIRELLGDEAFNADGTLNREAVGARIFADDALRGSYNRILFPAIERATVARIAAIRDADPHATLVHEIPLYTGRALPWTYDYVVTVEADDAVRAERLITGRGYSPQHAADRIAAQGASGPREAIADLVVHTDGTMQQTVEQVETLWQHAQSLPHTEH
ncbi:dephospho-CoA kinase [Microbacterium sp. YY-03]|uniref:dephospho-CoA kinase n=1 Tax=Microbacterium sp. YY-03 TaxID=3421636 RepID=UPI003D17D9B8